jgi:PAS domain S-box-containing protein
LFPIVWTVRPRQIAPVALTLALTIAGFVGARLLGERGVRQDSQHRAEVAAAQIRARVEEGTSLVESLRRFMASVPGAGVTSEEFASNASRWLSPAGFPAAAWVEKVPASRRAIYERRFGQPIVTFDRRLRIVPVGPRSSYLPMVLVSGIPPTAVPGLDLGGEPGIAAALARARTFDDARAAPLTTLVDGTTGFFLVSFAPRSTGAVVRPGFVVVFVSAPDLRAAATDAAPLQLTVGGSSAADLGGAPAVRSTFTEAGQRFDVAVPREPVRGAAAVLPWIILAAGLVLAVLAGVLGVTAARRAKAKAEVDRIFTLSPDLITVADFDGRFTRVNPAAEKILGYTEEELLARPYLDLVHPDDRERTATEASAIGRGKTTLAFENRFVRKDGSYKVLEWTATPVTDDRLMYGMARDVTERRQAETGLARLAAEQAALRRVATLVARGAPPEEVFASVTEEVGRVLLVDAAALSRYEPDDMMTTVAIWSATGDTLAAVGGQHRLGGQNTSTLVSETGRPARIDTYAADSGSIADVIRNMGVSSSVGTPISVEGRLWGVIQAASTRGQALPLDTEERLANFTELVATAVANAESRAGLDRLAEEQAALRRVATLVARGVPPEEVFGAVTGEVVRLLPVDFAHMGRYEPDGTITVLAASGATVERFPVGRRWSLGGKNLATLVFETGRPGRIDGYSDAAGALGVTGRELGIRSSAGTPIIVEGRVWGVVIAGSTLEQPLSADIEARLGSFTELVATAVANSESRGALADSRARIVAAADESRRRIERDLHDGAQQRLVHAVIVLKLALRALSNTDADAGELVAEALRHAEQANSELRELAHGILPAALTRGGLRAGVEGLVSRVSLPVSVDVSVERLPAEVEATAYFVVSEALTNVVKHARAAGAGVTARVERGELRVEVRDDGVGGARGGDATGLGGLEDRVSALDGRLVLDSPPGRGTRVCALLPVSRQD